MLALGDAGSRICARSYRDDALGVLRWIFSRVPNGGGEGRSRMKRLWDFLQVEIPLCIHTIHLVCPRSCRDRYFGRGDRGGREKNLILPCK